jgi:ribosomal protein L18
MNDVSASREYCGTVRFGPDAMTQTQPTLEDEAWRQIIVAQHSQHALAINEWVTPTLEGLLREVLARLKLPREAVAAFVFSSSEVQAQSITLEDGRCLIRISSALINLLEGEELQFVLAHEVGHFLFRHTGYNAVANSQGLARFHASRNQEISADRIGYIGAGNLDACIRALIKTCSGLKGSHLRFDVAAYLNQIAQVANTDPGQDDSFQTHPSLIVRSRALLFFSLDYSDLARTGAEGQRQALKERMDKRIINDLARFTEPGRVAAIAKAARMLEFWYCAERILRAGKFTKEDQAILSKRLGDFYRDKLRSLLQSADSAELAETFAQFIERVTAELKDISPNDWAAKVAEAKSNAALVGRMG